MRLSEVRNGFVVFGGYVLAGCLILAPLAEYLAAGRPLHLRRVDWRLGVGEVGLRSLVTPLLGFLLATVLATRCHHWILARLLAGASAVGGLIALVAIPLVTLGALDMSAGGATGWRGLAAAFDLATVGLLLVLMATVVVTFALARRTWVGTRDAAWDARHVNRTAFKIHFPASAPDAETEAVSASRLEGPLTGAASSAGAGAADRRNGVPALITPDNKIDRGDPRPIIYTPGPSWRSSRGVGKEGVGLPYVAGSGALASGLASPPPHLNGDKRRWVPSAEIQRWEEEGGATSARTSSPVGRTPPTPATTSRESRGQPKERDRW